MSDPKITIVEDYDREMGAIFIDTSYLMSYDPYQPDVVQIIRNVLGQVSPVTKVDEGGTHGNPADYFGDQGNA